MGPVTQAPETPLAPEARAIVEKLPILAFVSDDAKKLIHVGDSKPDASIPEAEFAAWTMLASSVLNLDEALNK